MSTATSDDQLCQAILKFVTDGAYPESEDVVAADFPASAIPLELKQLSEASGKVENEISTLSRESAWDVDGWISQARQLHADIERSRLTARDIVEQHEKGATLREEVTDASKKVELLRTEIGFNQALTETLEEIQRLGSCLDVVQEALEDGHAVVAIERLEDAKQEISSATFPAYSSVAGLLAKRASDQRQGIVEHLISSWRSHIQIDRKLRGITISGDTQELESIVQAASRLTILEDLVESLHRDLLVSGLNPILRAKPVGTGHTISVENNTLLVAPEPIHTEVAGTINNLQTFLGYLSSRLPHSILEPLSPKLIPTLCSTLVSSWLSTSIPITLQHIDAFHADIEHVLDFSQSIESNGWGNAGELISWVEQIPRLWLSKRRVNSLDEVRIALSASRGETKRVERIETQQVSRKDDVFVENGASDDWDADWGSDNEDESGKIKETKVIKEHNGNDEEEEDVSAWGLDDDDSENIEEGNGKSEEVEEQEDAGDAWGWGDEDEEDNAVSSNDLPVAKSVGKSPAKAEDTSSDQREVTLKEHYTVTDIPDSILEIILRQVSDSETMMQPGYPKNRVSSSATGLLALPTLVLAMFRATSPTFYPLKFPGGQMYLYNDSIYLAEKLRSVVEEHKLSRLQSDIESIEKYGKVAYSKEMQTQRTVLSDLLDGAQGFSNCSEQPYLGECENAVAATIDRVKTVYKEWQSILSQSVLLQSIGSLISTVINKIVIDIEDLSDISESDSQRLAAFCNQFTVLEDLFLPKQASGPVPEQTEAVPLTPIYVRNWLKFRYLTNILESSLADIKYLWTEAGLQLEFAPDEVIDLIAALFADSDYRRKAIADIRRSSREA